MSEASWGSEETLAGDETVGGTRPKDRARPLERGTSIGRYVVLERVGVGGMGVVHAAYDPKLDRAVALKVLVPREDGHDDTTASQRLLREAQAMARLSHPNVVAVHDVGLHQERVFVAMELVEGTTLTDWLERAPRSVREILEVFVLAGRGLHAAHTKGLVHRDFKPDNVMVGHESGPRRVQVMDFGLARAAEDRVVSPVESHTDDGGLARPPMSDELTHVGQVLGTPRFMAPEQHLRGEVDARSDQFAFCVALWLALFGRHPFGALDATANERTAKVIAGEPEEPPPVPGVGARLRRALRRGLAADRDQRWPTMEELLAELEHDPSRTRRRIGAAVAVAVVAGGLVGAQRLRHAHGIAGCEQAGARIEAMWDDAARERVRAGMLASGAPQADDGFERLVPWLDRATSQWAEARREACIAAEVDERWDRARYAIALDCLEGQREDLETLLEVLGRADRDAVDGAVPRAADLRPAGLCVDERYLALQPEIADDEALAAERSEIRAALVRAHGLISARYFDDARAGLDAIEPRLAALDRGHLHVSALQLRARLDESGARFDAAAEGYRQALLLALELGALHLARDSALELATVVGIGQTHPAQGLEWLDVAEALSRRIGEDDDAPSMLPILDLRASLELERGHMETALALAERAVAQGERVLGADHPRLAHEVETLARVHRELGRYDSALALARRSLAMTEASLGARHPAVATGLETVAETLRQRGDLEEVVAVRRRVLELSERVHPPGHPAIGRALGNLGLTLHELGRSQEGLALLDRGVAILTAVHGTDHADLAKILINRGNALQTLGELEAAKEAFERVLALPESALEPHTLVRAVARLNLGVTESLLDRPEPALAHLHLALEALERIHGPDHPRVAVALLNIANVDETLERDEAALAANARALAILEQTYGPDHPEVAYALIGIAQAELHLNRPERALSPAERAMAIRRSHPVLPPELATTRWTLALALRANGRDDARAQELARLARPVFAADHDEIMVAAIERFLSASPGGPG